MPVLSASSQSTTVLAPPLPVSNSVFARNGLVFRRNQFSLIAAAPGVGKTLFATNLAARTPVPSLYFSADSDEWTVKQRACSILTGNTLETVEAHLNSESDSWEQFYTDRLRAVDHIDFCYNPDIELEFIVKRMLAHGEIWGDHPQLIIVDNLGNTVDDQDNEGAELRKACRELQRIARTTKAHVMGLHHVSGVKENGDKPILLGDLLYKLGKIPEVVLGLHWPNFPSKDQVALTVPKYRGGPHGMQINLPIDYTRATLGGFTV